MTAFFASIEQSNLDPAHPSYDIWSIGIIMHILITNGIHPYYSPEEGPENFKKKLASLTKIEADP